MFNKGRVDLAGWPMMTHPRGVFAASWHLSVLHVSCSCVCTCMQSLPNRRIEGQSFLFGNLWARCERPGILDTSCGVGTNSAIVGISCVKALIGIALSFLRGVMERPVMVRPSCGDPIPCIVVIM